MNKLSLTIFNAARSGASGRTALAIASLALGGAGAQASTVLAEWSFNSGGTAAARLASSSVPAGFTVTGLSFNGLTTDVSSGAGFFNAQEGGGSVIPGATNNGAAVDYDGIGFGGNNSEQVIFMHRANFADGAGPNPGDYTSFGPSEGTTAGDGDGNAAISFQVTATTEPVVVIGVTARQFGNDALKFGVQQAGAAAGVMATVNRSIATAYLNSPVIVAAGETKTFTISLDSTNGVNTVHNLDYIHLIAGNGLAVGQSSPTADGADIAQLDPTGKTASGGVDAIWGNQPAQGTTFTTGNNASGYELRSFSMQVDANTDARTWSMRTRVVALSSQSDTEVDSVVRDYSEALVYGQFDTDASGNNFITFVFDTPVHLEANRVYGIDMTTGPTNGYGFPPYYRSDNPYSGGRAYRAGTPYQAVSDPNSTLVYPDGNRDRVFHLDLEATVGESGSWTAATDSNWDSSTANWSGTTDSLFAAGDLVSFGDTGAGTVTLQENVAPGTVSFANTAGNDYTIASDAPETLSAAGGISLTGAGDVTIDSVIAGGTSIAHSGTGTLTLNGTNTFTGGVTLAAGATLDISGAQSLGDYSQATALTIADGASLIVGNGDSLNDYGVGSIKLSGAGVGGAGAIDFTGNNYSLFNGEWDLLDDTTIDTVGRMDYDGPVSTTGAANVVLTKNGSGRLMVGWDLSGATNLVEVVIAAGELYFEGSPDNGSTEIRMQSGTTLARFHTGDSTTNGDFVLEGATLTTAGADNLVYTWSGDFSVDAASTFTTQKTTHSLVTTGALSGAGDIALGAGTVRFDGSTSSYSGDVSFSGNSGTVEVNGDYSGATGTLYVADGTTLTGTGTWGGDVMVYYGGTLVDTNLTVNGTVTYGPAPFAAIADPADLIANSEFLNNSNLEDNGNTFAAGAYTVRGSNSDWGNIGSGNAGLWGKFADVDDWTHFNNGTEPSVAALLALIGTVNNPSLVADVPEFTLDGTDKFSTGYNTSGFVNLNSAGSYRNGMVQLDILNGASINSAATYRLSVDAKHNTNHDHAAATFTYALTTGAGVANGTDLANVLPGTTVQSVNSGTLPTAYGTPQTLLVSGADLTGTVNVLIQNVNTEAVEPAPAVVADPGNLSQVGIDSVSLILVIENGDVNKDGVIDQDDVDLANLYLAGDGGDDAATRQAALIADGMTAAEALAYLNLTDFDIDSDNDFDAADVTALEALLVVPDVVIESSGFNGTSFEVQVSGLVNGTTYYLMRDSDLSDGADFTTEADSVTASSDTATLSDDTPPADQAFYQVTD